MNDNRRIVRVLIGAALVGVTWGTLALTGGLQAGEKKQRGGTVIGTLAAKGPAYIEVKADGEEKARRYVPHWVGGAPAKGGGPDKAMLKTIQGLKVGSRVKVEWVFEEHLRVVGVEVLKAADGKGEDKKKEESKKSAEEFQTRRVIGELVGRGSNWVEVKADGDDKGRKYFLHRGGSAQLHKAMKETPAGSRVEVEWFFLEAPRVVSLQSQATKE